MNVIEWCFIFMSVFSMSRSQISQSFVTIEQPGTDFIPANSAELIAVYTDPSTSIDCYHQCHFNRKCQTVVIDTTWPFTCRLYESSIDTGTLISGVSSTSHVATLYQVHTQFFDYNQPCHSSSVNPYPFLTCIHGFWHCVVDTYWNGSICLNKGYYNYSCQSDDACRSDMGLKCDQFSNKCMCNSINMVWTNLTCSSNISSTTVSTITTAIISTTSTTTTTQACNKLWEQCGGQYHSGPTCCIDSICFYYHQYYSQCLPMSTLSTSSSTSVSSNNSAYRSGITTRYWDCCKPSCSWSDKASVTNPVRACAIDGITSLDVNTQSGCNGGTSFTCDNQQPWSINDTFAYGYAGVRLIGQTEANWCCTCYSLIFTSGPAIGKQMIVQVTNTGGDLSVDHFDLQIPGGGMGSFSGCLSQYTMGSYSWGQQYGGVSSRSDCANLPVNIQAGCYWRFDWFMNADNPSINFKQVSCPSELTIRTSCIRNA